jgi:hypothetical protein
MKPQVFNALLILKPDILAGPYARCDAALARDTIRGLFAVYTDSAPGPYEVETSEAAVGWGKRNIFRKVEARPWYTAELWDSDACLHRLATLSEEIAGPITTAQLVLDLVTLLGFQVTLRQRHTFTYRDLLGLYAGNTHFSRLAGDLREYLLDRPIEIFLLRGAQEPTSLHILKEMIRRVVRYPTTHYDALENLLHVADPGAEDWTYFAGIVGSPS